MASTFASFITVSMGSTTIGSTSSTMEPFVGTYAAQTVANHAEKPGKFSEEGADVQATSALDDWTHSEYLCLNYVLNGLVDELYNVYCKIPSAKELWDTLEYKYKTKNTGMTFSETFQVASIIEKLPPRWVDFKSYLKHKRKEMTIEDLVVRLRIEEDNRVALKGTQVEVSTKANMVEHGQSSRWYKGNKNHKPYGKGKGKFDLGPRKGGMKKNFSVFKGKCYNCGEFGHRVDRCNKPKKERANMIDEDEKLVAMITDLTSIMHELKLVSNHPKGWWIDTGATRHLCPDKTLFSKFRRL
ncbi:uncharacterized protein LOC143601320 [Bidens hawaiensis]|uniref:uncharacterized protein LOC143601320 n=1 Tax=Bidens hawaiensis TaxID=980011 RepID=UPI00404B1EE0